MARNGTISNFPPGHSNTEKCATLGHESSKPDNRQFMLKNPGNRVGFQATPILQIGQTISSQKVKKGQILKSLKRVNFTGTSVDSKALELLLSNCKNLQKMIMDDETWNVFFSMFEIDDDRGGISVGKIVFSNIS